MNQNQITKDTSPFLNFALEALGSNLDNFINGVIEVYGDDENLGSVHNEYVLEVITKILNEDSKKSEEDQYINMEILFDSLDNKQPLEDILNRIKLECPHILNNNVDDILKNIRAEGVTNETEILRIEKTLRKAESRLVEIEEELTYIEENETTITDSKLIKMNNEAKERLPVEKIYCAYVLNNPTLSARELQLGWTNRLDTARADHRNKQKKQNTPTRTKPSKNPEHVPLGISPKYNKIK